METKQKTYPDYILVRGTCRGQLVLLVGGDHVILKITDWGRDWETNKWYPTEAIYADWLSRITRPDPGNARKLYLPKGNITELVLGAEAHAIPIYNGYKRRGKLTDEEWAMVSALPDSRARERYRARTTVEVEVPESIRKDMEDDL